MELTHDREWVVLARAERLPPGGVLAVELDGDELVLWRAATGALCAMPRRCPHLDHDLAEGRVVAAELVCPGHGWSFDTTGAAGKRTERGRLDAKGTVETLVLRERDGVIEARRHRYRPPP